MFLCERHITEIFEDDWHETNFTACLIERTSNKRPYVDAIKINIPTTFIDKGIAFERANGRMHYEVLTIFADDVILQLNMKNKKFWAWVEPEE